jgi:putative transposase
MLSFYLCQSGPLTRLVVLVGSPDQTRKSGNKEPMPLRKRKYYQGNAYYITTSVNKFVKIFKEKRYIDIILKNIKFYKRKYNFKLLAYVIMPDHLHLLIFPKQDSVEEVSNLMGDFKRFTSRSLRKQMEEDEKTTWLKLFKLDVPKKKNWEYQIWQERFDDLAIYTPTIAKVKINYIHNNPVRKGLVERPEDYLYSSARNYVLDDHSIIEVDTDFLLF